MLVGRAGERRLIETMIAGARVGESGVAVLTGDAGIGKTALLEWAAESAGGMRVLRATGIEAEQEIPFAGLFALLRPVLDLVEALPQPQADALAGALALRTATAADRFGVGAGTLGLICRAAEKGPLAVLLDDAHLLDRPSAEALAFAGRRLLADQVLMLATVRAGEPCALTEAGLREVRIGGLDVDAAHELVGRRSALPGNVLDRLYRATEGNPLALLELSADPGRLLRLPPDTPVPVPAAVARAVQRLTDRLDSADRTGLLVAATSSGELTPVLRAATMLGVADSTWARLEDAELIRIADGQVRFRHPLVRSSVYAAADPAQRRAAHRMLAAALPVDDLDRRAWHLAGAAAGPDDESAVLLDAVAARAAARGADAVAATASERAAALSSEAGIRAARLAAAGESAWLAGQAGRSGLLLARSLQLAVDPMVRIRVQELLGAVAARSGSLTDALARLTTAADQAITYDPDIAVVLLADAINACFYLGDSASAMTATNRVEALLPATATVRAKILGLIAVGCARVIAGRGGVAEIRRAVDLLASSGGLQDDPRRAAWMVLGPLLLRESGTGRELVQRAVDESRRRAAIGTLPGLLFHVARDDATTDRWGAAGSQYHEAIRLARETGQLTELAASLAGLGWLEGRQGDRAGAALHLAESAQLCRAHEIHLFRAWSFFGMADLEFGLGAAETALEYYDNLALFLQDKAIADVDLSPEPERVETLVRLGRLEQARAGVLPYLQRAQQKGQPWALARAARAQALVAPDEEIDELFAVAMSFHAKTLDDFERARTQLAYGSRLRRARRRTAARAPLRSAFEVFDRLGAVPYAGLAAVELRATGEHAKGRGASLATELTPQELQIATLLASGRSTREAATALFLSPKTVEYHLRHVYTKLDVHSRDALAQRLSAETTPGAGESGR